MRLKLDLSRIGVSLVSFLFSVLAIAQEVVQESAQAVGLAAVQMPTGLLGLGSDPSRFVTFSGGTSPGIIHQFNGTDVDARGKKCTYCSWRKVDNPQYVVGEIRRFVNGNSNRWGLISQQLINRGQTLRQCIGGANDGHWQKYGQALRTLSNVIVRLGWEVGDGFPWDRGTGSEYAECFRRVATIIRRFAPQVKFEFNAQQDHLSLLNSHYPGPIVDFIGTDIYDTKSWTVLEDRLDTVRKFAKDHGARLAVSEWGLRSSEKFGFNDHPDFIVNMKNYFSKHSSPNDPTGTLGYAIYFDSGDSVLTLYPNSRNAFRNAF